LRLGPDVDANTFAAGERTATHMEDLLSAASKPREQLWDKEGWILAKDRLGFVLTQVV
jgi:hypothetical protein